MKRPRVLVADDHSLVVEGFRRLLEPEFELMGTVEDGRQLLTEAERCFPDVILLDISMPGLNGLDAARQLQTTIPQTKIIFLTMHADRAYVTEAFRVGASGYLLKRSAAAELTFAIHQVLKGHQYVTPAVTRTVMQSVLEGRGESPASMFSGTITARQREVLQLVAEGRTVKEIADSLSISVKAVEYHKTRMMERLGLRSTAELTRYAIAEGLVTL